MAIRDKVREREVLLLILCVLVAFALRFYTFDRKSLWLDEIYTIEDSRDDLKSQISFYKDNPTYLHPPLFFILTHQFYPFSKPERDLRIIPLVFGILSIPMIYLLAKQFSPSVALPCALSLAFMTYHISLSQDGRSYSLLMFLGMVALYFLMRHLITSKRKYLLLVAFFYSLLFYTSYSSIPFIVFSQILWFYRPSEEAKRPTLFSFLTLNGLILAFCLPWILFVAINYKGQTIMDPLHLESSGSLGYILYGVFHDWVPHAPLMIASVLVLILFPILPKFRRNAFILLGTIIFPIAGVYIFCKLSDFSHFVTSRYFINSISPFFIALFLSLEALEERFPSFRRFPRMKFLFVILFIASNLVILPIYYRSEKQDFRGLANYLTCHIRAGDKVIVSSKLCIRGLLYYFGIPVSDTRDYLLSEKRVSGDETEYSIALFYKGNKFTVSHSKTYWNRYIAEGNRVWLVVDKKTAKEVKKVYPLTLKGYFDGSVLNLVRFPTDASMYLLLWDPEASGEKGINLPID
jgi:uncharacterized membrane protein